MDTPKQLGIIFIINYPLSNTSKILGQDITRVFLAHLEGGYFNYSRYINSEAADIYFLTCLPNNTENPKSPNTIAMKLQWDKNDKKYKRGEDKNFGAVNLGNKDVLSAILTYIVNAIKAIDYVLFLFNHSSNFGLGRAIADQDSIAPQIQIKPVHTHNNFMFVNIRQNINFLTKILNTGELTIPGKKIINKKIAESSSNIEMIDFEEYSNDYKDDMLTNSELAVALTRAFILSNPTYNKSQNRKPIKIIFSAGCYFQNIDTTYSLKNVADYLVGAEGIMPANSFNYSNIVNSLLTEVNNKIISKNPINYKKAACETVEAFADQYKNDGSNILLEMLRYCYISCLNTEHVEELKDSFNHFLRYCIGKHDIIRQIRTVRTNSSLKDVSRIYPEHSRIPLFIFDFKYLIERINSKKMFEKDKLGKKIFNKLINSLGKIVEASMCTSDNTYMNNCNGLSIYFPKSIDKALETYNFTTFYSPTSKYQSYFATDSYWPDFLLYYYKFLTLSKRKQ